MATVITIELKIEAPIELELATAPGYYIGTAQVEPTGPQEEPGGTPMATAITIELEIVAPIELELATAPVYYIGTAQVGPTGPQGLPGGTLWEADTLTTIKPILGKTVDANYITGVVYGGLFQP